MNENMPSEASLQGQRVVATGLTTGQIREAFREQDKAKARRVQQMSHQQAPMSPRQAQMLPFEYYSPAAAMQAQEMMMTHHLSERRKKRVKKTLTGVAVSGLVVILTGGAYTTNLAGFQDMAQNLLGNSSVDQTSVSNGITMSEPFVGGKSSLSMDQCKEPEAAYLVATVTADMPLVPILPVTDPETGKSTIAKLSPYLTKEGDATPEYNHVTINNLPLALTICEPSGGVRETNNVYTIDHSKLKVSFEDPIGLTGTPINPQYQMGDPTKNKLQASKGEYMTLPSPLDKMSINTDNDPILKQSVEALTASMQDPEQVKLLLALVEKGAVKQLDNVVKQKGKITYQDANDKSLQDVIDKLLVQRLGGDMKTTHFRGGNYDVTMDVPRDPKTKQYITDNASNTLKYLDATQPVNVTSIDVKYGGVKAPKTAQSAQK